MSGPSDRRGALVALAVIVLLVQLAKGQQPTLYAATGPSGQNDIDDTNQGAEPLPCSNSWRPESQCMQWKEDGECSGTNSDWMMEHCHMACTQCTPEPYMSPDSRLGPWRAVLCEQGYLRMDCPAGYHLRVEDAYFGRSDAMPTCNIDDVVTHVQGCEHDAMDALQKICEDVQTCRFTISSDVLGISPCLGYNHYINVSFSCELPMKAQISCETDYVALQCYAGESISVQTAMFGSVDSEVCNDDGSAVAGCMLESVDTSALVADLCNGREWCTFESSTQFFGGDPCTNAAKYTKVDYTCSPCENALEDDSQCDIWANEGQCTLNRDWMYGYCRKACSHCDVSAQCLDVSDDDDCFYWATIGECHHNPLFMHPQCTQSCNQCWDVHPDPEVTEVAEPVRVVPDTMPGGTMMVRQCGLDDLVLSCPPGSHVLLHDVFYGRREGSVCLADDGVGNNEICDAMTTAALDTASYVCNGRQSCNLYPGTPPFTDPCPGKVLNRYLEAHYTCEPCNNAHGNDDCAYWQSWYECDYNPTWMNNNCFSSCSGCAHVGCANGVDGDGWCDYWAASGECASNPDFMPTACALSCRTCYLVEGN